MSKREEKARREFQGALKDAEADIGLVEPTEDEKRNGWTAESLTAYVRESQAAASLRIDPQSAMRKGPPKRANSRYNAFRWRR